MKKTERVNISGIIFNIDEDGYKKLRSYLDAVALKFDGREEGKEIVADIEARIAELFQEALVNNKMVITIEDVDHVIVVMGHPDDYDSSPEDESAPQPEEFRKGPKRMYRDPDNAYLAGVCSGVAAYFNIDPTWVRVAFLLPIVFFGTGIWVYLILWIVVPKAKNTAQKLEMRGQDVNVGSIERSIRDEFESVRANLDDLARNVKNNNSQDSIRRILHLFVEIISFFARFVGKFVGIVFVLVGISLLVGFSIAIATGSMAWPFMSGNFHISLGQFFDVSPSEYTVGIVALAVIICIPLLVLIYIGSKLLFNYRTSGRIVGFSSLGIWVVGIVVLSVVVMDQLQNYRVEESTTTTAEVKMKQDTIVIKTVKDEVNTHQDFDFNMGRLAVGEVNNKYVIYGRPKMNIERSEGNKIEVVLIRNSRGASRQLASEFAKKITYNWKQDGSALIFDPHFFVSGPLSWKVQDLSIILKVPVGKVVALDESSNEILYDIQNVDNYWDGNMVGKKWQMTKQGLKLLRSAQEAQQDSLKQAQEKKAEENNDN